MPRHTVNDDDAGRPCPYCRFPLKRDVHAHRCDRCGALHHEDCWREGHGCAVLGCAGANSGGDEARPATAAPAQDPGAPGPSHGNRWGRVAGLAAIAVLLIGGGVAVAIAATGDETKATSSSSTATVTTTDVVTQDPTVARDNALRPAYFGRWSAFCRTDKRQWKRQAVLIRRPGLADVTGLHRSLLRTYRRFDRYLRSSAVPSTETEAAIGYARYLRRRISEQRRLLRASRAGDSPGYNQVIRLTARRDKDPGVDWEFMTEGVVGRLKYCRTWLP